MRDTDFIIKQGWMVTRLHLSGAALEIYALIYGYTKDGESWYECNISNISEWLLVTDRTVQNHLSDLIKAGYITRKDNKYGRGSKAFFQVNVEIIERMEKGENFSLLKRVKKITEKGENFSEKGEKNDIAPYISILIKDKIRIILLRACTREEEEKEFFKIFFFMGAADPAAEVAAFVRWNEANSENWESLPMKRKYYYASQWRIQAERQVSASWLQSWASAYGWAVENDSAFAPRLLDLRAGASAYVDNGVRIYEMRVTSEQHAWLTGHRDEVLRPFFNHLAAGRRVEWKLI